MAKFLGVELYDNLPSTGGVIPVIGSDGRVYGMTIPAAAAAAMEGRGSDTISEKTAGAGVTVDGALLKDAGVFPLAGSAAGAVALGLGASASEGLQIKVLDETISHAANAALSKALTTAIPAGAVILSVQANATAALTGGSTTVKYGIGISSDPDKYGLSSALTKNTKTNTILDWAVLSGEEALGIYACATNGAAGDTALTVGSVRVRVAYLVATALTSAA